MFKDYNMLITVLKKMLWDAILIWFRHLNLNNREFNWLKGKVELHLFIMHANMDSWI